MEQFAGDWKTSISQQLDPSREASIRIYAKFNRINESGDINTQIKGSPILAGKYVHKGDIKAKSGSSASVTWSQTDIDSSVLLTREAYNIGEALTIRDLGTAHMHPNVTKKALLWSGSDDYDDLLAGKIQSTGLVEVLTAKTDLYTEVAINQRNMGPILPIPKKSLTGAQLAGVMNLMNPGHSAVYGGQLGEPLKRIEPTLEGVPNSYIRKLFRAKLAEPQ